MLNITNLIIIRFDSSGGYLAFLRLIKNPLNHTGTLGHIEIIFIHHYDSFIVLKFPISDLKLSFLEIFTFINIIPIID